jgi:hypothetical protein
MLLEYYQKIRNFPSTSKNLRDIKNSRFPVHDLTDGFVGPTVCYALETRRVVSLNIHASSKALWKFILVRSPSLTIIECKNWEGSMCNMVKRVIR